MQVVSSVLIVVCSGSAIGQRFSSEAFFFSVFSSGVRMPIFYSSGGFHLMFQHHQRILYCLFCKSLTPGIVPQGLVNAWLVDCLLLRMLFHKLITCQHSAASILRSNATLAAPVDVGDSVSVWFVPNHRESFNEVGCCHYQSSFYMLSQNLTEARTLASVCINTIIS